MKRRKDHYWFTGDQLSNEPTSPIGFAFDMTPAETTDNPLPPEFIYAPGQEANTQFDGLQARLVLKSFCEANADDELYRSFSTSFTLFNDAAQKIEFNKGGSFHAKSNRPAPQGEYGYRPSQTGPADVSAEPGQTVDFVITWQTISGVQETEGILPDQGILIAINTAPNSTADETVVISDDSVFQDSPSGTSNSENRHEKAPRSGAEPTAQPPLPTQPAQTETAPVPTKVVSSVVLLDNIVKRDPHGE